MILRWQVSGNGTCEQQWGQTSHTLNTTHVSSATGCLSYSLLDLSSHSQPAAFDFTGLWFKTGPDRLLHKNLSSKQILSGKPEKSTAENLHRFQDNNLLPNTVMPGICWWESERFCRLSVTFFLSCFFSLSCLSPLSSSLHYIHHSCLLTSFLPFSQILSSISSFLYQLSPSFFLPHFLFSIFPPPFFCCALRDERK